MEQCIPKSAVVAEIENLLKPVKQRLERDKNNPWDSDIALYKFGDQLIKNIETLGVKEVQEEPKIPQVFDEGYWERLGEEPVSEDLEIAAELYTLDDSIKPWRNLTKEAFKAGAKWQKKKDQEAVEIAREETLQKVKEKLLIMLNTSIDNKHFFEQLDDYIEELENEQ